MLTKITLNDGETYIGAIGNKSVELYHLVLLPGDNDYAPQNDQLEWAKSIGGDLPNKLESAMLHAHAKEQFQPTGYWTNETFVDHGGKADEGCAWFQYFSTGYQTNSRTNRWLRARAIRRIAA